TSVSLDEETLARIGQIAESMNRPRDWLMAEAIKQYVAREDWLVQEVEKGLKAADEGRLIDHSDIRERWEAKRGNRMD
ncbi:MAG: CopG family ribbon-helix-helix protein, partial [Oceanobacter sp.]